MGPYDLSLVNLAFLLESLSQLQFYRDLTGKKNNFFEGSSWFKFNNLRLVLSLTWQFYSSVTKALELKVRKDNSYSEGSFR